MNYTKEEQDFHIRQAYKTVITDLKKQVGRKCKDYSVGCFVCACHRMAEDLKSIVGINKE